MPDDHDYQPIDEAQVHAYASEIAASIDTSAIRVDMGEEPVRLFDIVPPQLRTAPKPPTP